MSRSAVKMRTRVNVSDVPVVELTLDDDGNVQEYHPKLQRLPDFIGSGSFGIAIGNGKHCIKMADIIREREILYATWASQLGVGPKLICHGFVVVPQALLKRLKLSALRAGLPLPYRLKMTESSTDSIQLNFIAFEQWTMTLHQWLSEEIVSQELIEPIVQSFKHKLGIMRREGVVHGDLMPRNILVRVVDRKLTDVCLTDFADAFCWKNWFSSKITPEKFRSVTLGIFKKFNYNDTLKHAVHALNGFQLTADECMYNWMLYEPHNLDQHIMASLCYHVGAGQHFPLEKPREFNFAIPWDKTCLIRVSLRRDNLKQEFTVCGLKTLAKLRRVLNEYGSTRFKSAVFVTTDGRLVDPKDEATTYPSACIRTNPDNQFYMEMTEWVLK